jgi:hypothetical protein
MACTYIENNYSFPLVTDPSSSEHAIDAQAVFTLAIITASAAAETTVKLFLAPWVMRQQIELINTSCYVSPGAKTSSVSATFAVISSSVNDPLVESNTSSRC